MKGGAFLSKKLSRMGIKGYYGRHQPITFGRFTSRRHNLLMTAMHTIKIANSGRKRRPIQGGVTYLPTDHFGHFSIILYHRAALYRRTTKNINLCSHESQETTPNI